MFLIKSQEMATVVSELELNPLQVQIRIMQPSELQSWLSCVNPVLVAGGLGL